MLKCYWFNPKTKFKVQLKNFLLISCAVHFFIILFFIFKLSSSNIYTESRIQNSVGIREYITTKVITQTEVKQNNNPNVEDYKTYDDKKSVNQDKNLIYANKDITSKITVKTPIPNKKKKIKNKIIKNNLRDLKKELNKQALINNLKRDLENNVKEQNKNVISKNKKNQVLNKSSKKIDNNTNSFNEGEIDKYKAAILQAIESHWIVSDNLDKNLNAVVIIKLNANGDVMDVMLVKSSGNIALDRSARVAIFKASPLPMPKENFINKAFREIKLNISPQNL